MLYQLSYGGVFKIMADCFKVFPEPHTVTVINTYFN